VGSVDERLKEVQNETLGFQEVFIVNAIDRYDKLDIDTLATSLSGFRFKVIPGMPGKDVPRISLPATYDADGIENNIGINTIGAWRSELNALRQVVTDRLSSALILEDDVDWDVALKNQLLDIARGGRFFSNQTDAASHSPYGDKWDVLWLGHCGMGPHADDRRRFIVHQDPTAPPESRLHTIAGRPEKEEWAEKGTRIMFTGHGSCSWAYAVSNSGAHKILKAMSVDPFSGGFDNGMGGLCKEKKITCLTVFPPMFGTHAPIGDSDKESDIKLDKGGFRDKGRTYNVAYSVKLNLDHLVMNEREKSEPQWDDMPDIRGPVSRQYVV